MQTLLDPFEAAPSPPPAALSERRLIATPAPPPARRVSSTEVDLDFEAVEDRPASRQPGADSSGRLRYWCSDED